MELDDSFSTAVKGMMAQPLQMSLFDDDPPEAPSLSERVSAMAWSYSKRSMFEQCPLRYYYHYYGANKRLAKQETRKQNLHFIKSRVITRYLLSGKVLHLTIKTYFKYAQKDSPLQVGNLVSFARRVYRESCDYSRKHPTGDFVPDTPHPPMLLKEFYDQVTDAEELCESEEHRLLTAVEAFVSDDSFAELRKCGTHARSLVECPLRLSSLDCQMRGKIDLACRLGGIVKVVDWKIGESDDLGDRSLQLAVYGLWAIEHFGCTANQLKVCKAFLSSREVLDFSITEGVLCKARICILQDAERMASMDQYGRDGIAEAFSPTPYQAVCRMCIYERICHEQDGRVKH